ncbi:GntR family transcriptional regulator [Streptomyces sp. TRM 70361]|uniref:GntR family transcriptional regulator n=1 Tax=Streptomyces sp. TRM 70361 TaxID=3116553 RepID=UPI002E7B8686|nr:GntR family transcriptional regulator [Streptomyces sp. TRM 70361]MEE1938691.1 GntR family transcriptional regulator [Streptomyces sp. TRM 70361]
MSDSGLPRPRRPVTVHEPLRDQVAAALRAALTEGRLRPGTVYSAPALAAEYGVSATPVREAMLDLVREGLVETVRNKGFRVAETTGRDLADFTEIRVLLEVPTVGRVTAAATPGRLEALRPAAEETVAAARAGDPVAYLEADHRFHLGLLALSGNPRLAETVGDLRRRSRLHGLAALTGPGPLEESAQEHLTLLDLMLDGDAPAAEEYMRGHLTRLGELWAAGQRVPAGPVPGGGTTA